MKHLLQEDDCAPDARKSFNEAMGLDEKQEKGLGQIMEEKLSRLESCLEAYESEVNAVYDARDSILVKKVLENFLNPSRPLPCRRCGNQHREQTVPGLCSWCYAVVYPDSETGTERQEEVDRRIRQMREIHEMELAMNDYSRAQWIEAGKRILGMRGEYGRAYFREGESREGGIGLGPK